MKKTVLKSFVYTVLICALTTCPMFVIADVDSTAALVLEEVSGSGSYSCGDTVTLGVSFANVAGTHQNIGSFGIKIEYDAAYVEPVVSSSVFSQTITTKGESLGNELVAATEADSDGNKYVWLHYAASGFSDALVPQTGEIPIAEIPFTVLNKAYSFKADIEFSDLNSEAVAYINGVDSNVPPFTITGNPHTASIVHDNGSCAIETPTANFVEFKAEGGGTLQTLAGARSAKVSVGVERLYNDAVANLKYISALYDSDGNMQSCKLGDAVFGAVTVGNTLNVDLALSWGTDAAADWQGKVIFYSSLAKLAPVKLSGGAVLKSVEIGTLAP